MGGASSLSKGGASSSVGRGHRLWALGGLSIRGPWSSLVGVGRCSWALCHCGEAGLLFVRTGLLIVGSGAHSCGWVVRVCWFVVPECGGDVLSALWSSLATLEGTRVGVLTMDVSINNNKGQHRQLRGHRLVSADGSEGVTHHKEQRQTTKSSSFIIWLPCRSQ